MKQIKITKKDIGRRCAVKGVILLMCASEVLPLNIIYPWTIIGINKIKKKNHTNVVLKTWSESVTTWLVPAKMIEFPQKIKRN